MAATLANVMTLSMAVDLAVDRVVSAMLLKLPQNLESAQRTFYHLTAIEAVVSLLGGVTYDDMVELSQPNATYVGAKEPTLATRAGHPLPQLHDLHEGKQGFYISHADMSKAMHTNGSSSSPAAITWASRYVTPKNKAPRKHDGAVQVTKGVHTAVGIVSSGGARTPFHVEQKALGAANLLHVGRGKIWYLPAGNSLLDKSGFLYGGADPTATLYSKCTWDDWGHKPDTFATLGMQRVYQPAGYMMVTMPVRHACLPADVARLLSGKLYWTHVSNMYICLLACWLCMLDLGACLLASCFLLEAGSIC